MVREGDQKGGIDPTFVQWLLDAILKVKHQKQRPSVDRIASAIRYVHKDVKQDRITEQLELAVQDGLILKVNNKGTYSYNDPARFSLHRRNKTLQVHKKVDLTRIIIRAIRELAEIGGSSIRNVEKYIQRTYSLESMDSSNLMHCLRVSMKKAVESGQVIRTGQLYKIGTCSESESVASTASYLQSSEDDADPVEIKKVCIIWRKSVTVAHEIYNCIPRTNVHRVLWFSRRSAAANVDGFF
jgi:hypothetical protein